MILITPNLDNIFIRIYISQEDRITGDRDAKILGNYRGNGRQVEGDKGRDHTGAA